jgi:hypothetical protein
MPMLDAHLDLHTTREVESQINERVGGALEVEQLTPLASA